MAVGPCLVTGWSHRNIVTEKLDKSNWFSNGNYLPYILKEGHPCHPNIRVLPSNPRFKLQTSPFLASVCHSTVTFLHKYNFRRMLHKNTVKLISSSLLNWEGIGSDLCYVVDGKVALAHDVVAFHTPLPPLLIRVVGNSYHFASTDLQFILRSRLEVVVYVDLWLTAHNPHSMSEWTTSFLMILLTSGLHCLHEKLFTVAYKCTEMSYDRNECEKRKVSENRETWNLCDIMWQAFPEMTSHDRKDTVDDGGKLCSSDH